MSLDVSLLVTKPVSVFDANITHNLGDMARAAGLYDCLWRPEEMGMEKASQLVDPLREGLAKLKADPESFRKHTPENGWGSYDGLVAFVEKYLVACVENPDATVAADR